jgi:hypothetical protein
MSLHTLKTETADFSETLVLIYPATVNSVTFKNTVVLHVYFVCIL